MTWHWYYAVWIGTWILEGITWWFIVKQRRYTRTLERMNNDQYETILAVTAGLVAIAHAPKEPADGN